MRILRLYAAIALLRGAWFVAGIVAGPDLTGETSRRREILPCHPAERILLASLTFLAIYFVWTSIGRVWS